MLRHHGKAGCCLSLNIGPVQEKLQVGLGSITREVTQHTFERVASTSPGFGGRSRKANHFVETL